MLRGLQLSDRNRVGLRIGVVVFIGYPPDDEIVGDYDCRFRGILSMPSARHGSSRAPKPTSARRAPTMRVWLSSRRTSPLVFSPTASSTPYDDILGHCCCAWNKLMPWKIMSIGVREWAYRS